MSKQILVLAPHPDDECIGMGGTIRKHVVEGDTVHVLFITSGEKGVHDDDVQPQDIRLDETLKVGDRYSLDLSARAVREREAGVCSQILGYQGVTYWHETDGEFDPWRDGSNYEERLHDLLIQVQPQVLYVPHMYEAHTDHQGVAYLWELYKEIYGSHFMDVFAYEIWTPLQRPDTFIDITPYADYKRSAIRAHKSQWYNSFDEAVLALNHYRGLINGPNKLYVEAFERIS